MTYRSLELRVGLTIFIAVLILVIGMMWFQGFKIGRSTYELHAAFPMVGGIGKGDEVTVNGVERGEVRRVELRDKDVLVTMMLYSDVKVPDDSRVILQTIGVMGERIVSIILGESNKHLEPGSIMKGSYDPGISEAISGLGSLLDDLQRLSGDIHRITQVLMEGENLRMTVENLAQVTTDLRELIAENSPELVKGVSSFRSSADKVDGFLDRNVPYLDSMIVSMEAVSRELPELVDRIKDVASAVADITKSLEGTDSSLGVLLQDRKLIDRLEKAITGLDELITDIKANPRKYLKVEIF